MGWLATVNGWVRGVSVIPSALAGTGILFIMFLVTGDVFMRYFFNHSILGSYELVEYAMVVVVASALGIAQLNRFHIAVYVVVNNLPKLWRAALDSATLLIMLLLLIFTTWVGYDQTLVMAQRRLNSTVLMLPRWPFQAAMAVGLAVFCIFVARDLASSLGHALGKDVPDEQTTGEEATQL